MKLPTFKELKLTNYNVSELVESLKLQEAGLYPTYLVLNTNSEEETREVLDNLAGAFAQLNINPKFPYPFYAITDKVAYHKSVPICSKISKLPSHFAKDSKRIKGRELAMLNRTNLLKDKVVNLPFYERLTKLKKGLSGQRELYEKTKQLHYYETLLENLNSRGGRE